MSLMMGLLRFVVTRMFGTSEVWYTGSWLSVAPLPSSYPVVPLCLFSSQVFTPYRIPHFTKNENRSFLYRYS